MRASPSCEFKWDRRFERTLAAYACRSVRSNRQGNSHLRGCKHARDGFTFTVSQMTANAMAI